MSDYVKEYMLSKNNPATSLMKAKSVRFNIINNIINGIINNTIENGLSDKQKECIKLHIEGNTQNEIASKLGISQPVVSRHIIDAKSKINTQLDLCFEAVEIALKGYING